MTVPIMSDTRGDLRKYTHGCERIMNETTGRKRQLPTGLDLTSEHTEGGRGSMLPRPVSTQATASHSGRVSR